MALNYANQGSTRYGQALTWYAGRVPANLTGATITGIIQPQNDGMEPGAARAIVGALAIENAVGGVFTWAYAAGDVAEAGYFQVQFRATYPDGRVLVSDLAAWRVREALSL